MKKCLVTGAGTLGSAVSIALRRRGHDVVQIDTYPRSGGVLPVDLLDPDGLRAALSGCDSVIHTAAIHPLSNIRDADYMFNVNVVGTWNLVRAMREQSVRRLVHASTIGVTMWRSTLTGAGSEPVEEADTAYRFTKSLAEDVVNGAVQLDWLDAAILRFAAFDRTIEAELGHVPDEWRNLRAVVSVDEAVQATVVHLEAGLTGVTEVRSAEARSALESQRSERAR